MDYSAHRPQGLQGQGDSHLPKIVRKLRRTLAETQRDFAHDTLRLPSKALGELAGILVDFAEDLHAGTGIWAAYERYNVEFFGTALPLTSGGSGSGLNRRPIPSLPLDLVPGAHRQSDHLADAPGSPSHRRCRQRLPVRCLRRSPQGFGREGVSPDPQRPRLGREAEAGLARHALLHVPHDVRPLHGGAASRRLGHRAHRRLRLPGMHPLVRAGGHRHPGGSPRHLRRTTAGTCGAGTSGTLRSTRSCRSEADACKR